MMKTTKYILILLVVTLQTIQAQDESENQTFKLYT
jgi:hypothetical protein